MIYNAEYIVVIHCIYCFILKPKSLSFSCSHSLSFVFICCTTRCHPLSFVITRCINRCHSLHYPFSIVVIRCHSLYHSLSFVVPLVATRCHSLYHSLWLVVTQCTTRLFFYKRSICSSKLFNEIKENLLKLRNFFCFYKQTYIYTQMHKQFFKQLHATRRNIIKIMF